MAVNHSALLELTEALSSDSQKTSRGGSFMPGSDTIIKPRNPSHTTPRDLPLIVVAGHTRAATVPVPNLQRR